MFMICVVWFVCVCVCFVKKSTCVYVFALTLLCLIDVRVLLVCVQYECLFRVCMLRTLVFDVCACVRLICVCICFVLHVCLYMCTCWLDCVFIVWYVVCMLCDLGVVYDWFTNFLIVERLCCMISVICAYSVRSFVFDVATLMYDCVYLRVCMIVCKLCNLCVECVYGCVVRACACVSVWSVSVRCKMCVGVIWVLTVCA